MVAAPAVTSRDTRPLEAGDIEKVIAIDRAHSGHFRRRFFEKRFAAAAAQPDDYIRIGAVRGGSLRGFVIARILRGEFGHQHAVAVLDALGVEPESRERGIGRALMEELGAIMRRRDVHVLQSQADWTSHDLLRFFHACGFELAPRLVLQRSVAELLEETGEV
jgi:ribosomal protein S18 acetylase RimI-like enzyme